MIYDTWSQHLVPGLFEPRPRELNCNQFGSNLLALQVWTVAPGTTGLVITCNFLPWMDQCNARFDPPAQTHIQIHHFHPATQHTGQLPVFLNLHDVTAEREKVTEREEYLQHGGFQTRDEEEALLMICWAHQGDCLIGREGESMSSSSNNTDRVYTHKHEKVTWLFIYMSTKKHILKSLSSTSWHEARAARHPRHHHCDSSDWTAD